MSIKYPTGVEVHGKNLRIVFMYKGKRMRESLGIIDTNKNRKVAAGLRAAICYKIKTGEFNYAEEFPDSKNISIYCGSGKAAIYEDIIKSWVSIKEIEISASTLKKYKSILNALSNFINHNKIISSFTHEDILLIRKELLTSPTLDTDHKNNRLGRSVSTVNNYMRILKMVFEFAFNGGYTKTNIFSSVSELKKERVPPDPINQDEFARLLNAANNRQAANMLITSVYTGMRPGELCALSWEDIDFTTKTITVRRNISILGHFSLPKTKAGTDRVIHMLDPVVSCLRDQMPLTKMTGEDKVTVATREYGKTRKDICTFVFQPQVTASNGLKTKFYSPGGFGQVWNALIKKSGVRHRKAYQTRHTYACWMLSAGANPAFIATQMGHVSSKMIHDVYGAWMKENDADQIAIMNNNAPPMPHERYRKAI